MDLRILDAIHHKLALIAKVQAMRGANETRRARGAADAYDEGAFIEAADLADAALRANASPAPGSEGTARTARRQEFDLRGPFERPVAKREAAAPALRGGQEGEGR